MECDIELSVQASMSVSFRIRVSNGVKFRVKRFSVKQGLVQVVC